MIKKIALGTIIIIAIFIAYNLLVQITNALKSGERLNSAADLVYKLQAENSYLKKKLVQTQSQDFIEQQARDKLGLSKKGETIVIIPDNTLKMVLGASQSAEIRLPNWLGWWKVFFK